MSRTVTGNYPQKVQARQIIYIGPQDSKTSIRLIRLFDGTEVNVSGVMLTAFNPSVGDYYLVPSEGVPYFVAKSTFVQNYTVGS